MERQYCTNPEAEAKMGKTIVTLVDVSGVPRTDFHRLADSDFQGTPMHG